jgi:hypothetical protein
MARPRPERKSEPAAPAASKVLPMELQVGDRLADETSDWEVIAPPYSTAGGRMVHARVQRIDDLPVGRYEVGMLPSASA